jgi:hypothetical protein
VSYLAVRALPQGGVVVLAQGIPADGLDTRGARQVTVVARGVSADGAAPLLVGIRPGGKPWTSRATGWTKTTLGDGWARYTSGPLGKDGPLAQTLTDPRSQVDQTAARTPGQIVRLFGTKNLLP